MLNVIAQAADQSVSIGHVIMYTVAGVVVALTGGGAGVAIQKKRGGNKQSNGRLQPGIDYVTPTQCDRNHQIAAAQQKELQTLRDTQAQERHEQTLKAIGKIETSVETVHKRIDELVKNSKKD